MFNMFVCMHACNCACTHMWGLLPFTHPLLGGPLESVKFNKTCTNQDNSILFDFEITGDSLIHGWVYGLVGGWVNGWNHVKSLKF